MKHEDVYLRDYETPDEAWIGLGRYFAYYNHLQQRHRSLERRTLANVYGLEASASVQKVLVTPARTGILKTGGGRSVAGCAVVASATLRFASATAAGTLPMATVPPYSRPETVHRMGTS